MSKRLLTLLAICMMALTTVWADDATPDYLCFTAQEDGEIAFEGNGSSVALQYRKGTNGDWQDYTINTKIVMAAGDKVYFRATTTNETINSFLSSTDIIFTSTKKVAASGNIMSLLDATCKETTVPYGAFSYLFGGCTGLTSAPDLPGADLRTFCYFGMFFNCTSLVNAPELPSTDLAIGCYAGMFSGCTSLKAAPELPATKLASQCYYSMFMYCSSLTKIPELPATTMCEGCYQQMFAGCTSLALYDNILGPEWKLDVTVPTTATEWNSGMFYGTRGNVVSPVAGKTYYVASAVDGEYLQKNKIFYDGCNFTSLDLVSFTYERKYNGNWQPLYVPFSLKYDDWKDNFDVAYINGVRLEDTNNDGDFENIVMDVVKMKSGATQASMPYVIRARKSGIQDIMCTDGNIATDDSSYVDCSSPELDFKIIGTYHGVPAANMQEKLAMSNNGTLVSGNGKYGLSPHRWYVNITARTDANSYTPATSSSAKVMIHVIGEDDDIAGIELNDNQNENQNENENSAAYSLAGQRVGAGYKGVVIKNGKKYIVK